MTWYKTGTTTQTNGSPTITGAGTLWVDAGVLNPGDIYAAPDGKLYEILSIQSNTGLTLTAAYLGTTAAGAAYAIMPIGLLPSALAQQVKSVLTTANAALASAVLSTAAQGLTSTQQGNARANIAALGAADVGYGLLSKSVAGNSNVTLTATEAANQFLELTGVLTGNINVIVPAAARLFVVRNATTGAYTLTVKTTAGSGVTALQGGRMLIECDGTNCVDAASHFRQTGGSIDGTPIGGNTPAAVAATTLSAVAGPTAQHTLNGPAEAYVANSASSRNAYTQAGTVQSWNATPNAVVGAYLVDINAYSGANASNIYFGAIAGSVVNGAANFVIGRRTGATSWAETLRADENGNLLVGVASGSCHSLQKPGSQGTQHAKIGSAYPVNIYEGGAYGQNAAACVVDLSKNSSTSRSINAGGTINASGADYAEYEKNNGLTISKGSIVGFKADGTLTTTYAEAVRCGIKSTNPSLVGGDTWGNADAVGQRPEPPAFTPPEYTGTPQPTEPPALAADATPEQIDAHALAMAAYTAALYTYTLDQAQHAAQVAVAQGLFDTTIWPEYLRAKAVFEAALEAERIKVDRIAYSGKVPCNVLGATPGGYIIAVDDGGAIAGAFVADPDFAQYKKAVGRVNRILPDGRCEVAVIIH